MVLDLVKIKTKIYEDGALAVPNLPIISKTQAIVASTKTITATANTTDVSIPIANKGTILALFIWTDETTTDLTVKINGSAALNASDIAFTGPVTTLTISNANTDDDLSINLLVVVE